MYQTLTRKDIHASIHTLICTAIEKIRWCTDDAEICKIKEQINSLTDFYLMIQQIAEIRTSLPANLSIRREQIVLTAYSLVGKVNYFWGGSLHLQAGIQDGVCQLGLQAEVQGHTDKQDLLDLIVVDM